MEFKFNPSQCDHGTYSEIPQSNPIRWKVLHKEEDNSFTPVSKEFKCKDFLNDAVAGYAGSPFNIYSFNWTDIKLNEEGMYLLMTKLVNVEKFCKNVRSIKNVPGYGDEVVVEPYRDASAVLFIPRSYFKSTYVISLLSYLIRVSNISEEIADFRQHPTKARDNPFGKYYDEIMERGLKPPMESMFYFGKNKDNSGVVSDCYTKHDNGCAAWMKALEYGF